MDYGLWKEIEQLKYIIDDSCTRPLRKRRCKFKGCITFINHLRLKMGSNYCSVHTYIVAIKDIDQLTLVEKRRMRKV